MRLNKYAEKHGVKYHTAWNWFKAGKIPNAKKLPSGTIVVFDETIEPINPVEPETSNKEETRACIYARVSSSQNKENLESQADRLRQFCTAKGYNITKVVKEIGSGINDHRRRLEEVLVDTNFDVLVVEHEDRLARIGTHYVSVLLPLTNRRLEVVNQAEDDASDIMQDFVSIVTSFCARIYGLRRSKRKTEKIIREVMTGG